MPQHFQLEALHNYAPNATLILNIRPADAWVNSVTNWFGLGGRFLNTFELDTESSWQRVGGRNNALIEIYTNHTTHVRNFVQKYPSHPFLEIDIPDPNIGSILAGAFGLNRSCWTLHNKNKNETQKLNQRMKRIRRQRDRMRRERMRLQEQAQLH